MSELASQTHDDAQASCEALGGTLAIIRDADHQLEAARAIEQAMPGWSSSSYAPAAWIGLTKVIGSNYTFAWTTQSGRKLTGPHKEPATVNNPASPYAAWQHIAGGDAMPWNPLICGDCDCAMIQLDRNHYDATGFLVDDRGAWKTSNCSLDTRSFTVRALCQGFVAPPFSPPPPP